MNCMKSLGGSISFLSNGMMKQWLLSVSMIKVLFIWKVKKCFRHVFLWSSSSYTSHYKFHTTVCTYTVWPTLSRNKLLCQHFRGHRKQWISHKINIPHPIEKNQTLGRFWSYRVRRKKYTDVFKSGGNFLGQSASKRKNKLFIIKLPLKWLKNISLLFFAHPLLGKRP